MTGKIKVIDLTEFGGQGRSKSNFKFGILTAYGCVFYLHILDVSGETSRNITQAIVYVPSQTLDEHLNLSARHISHEAGQLIPQGDPLGGKPKTNALNPS